MAVFETTRPAPVFIAGSLSTFVARVVGNIATWNDARITRKALSKLSARELDDIGLSFADLDHIHTLTR